VGIEGSRYAYEGYQDGNPLPFSWEQKKEKSPTDASIFHNSLPEGSNNDRKNKKNKNQFVTIPTNGKLPPSFST